MPIVPAESFARAWADVIEGTSYVKFTPGETRELLRELADVLLGAVLADPPRLDQAAEVGSRLVSEHFTGADTLATSIDLIERCFRSTFGLANDDRMDVRLAQVCGALAAGYAQALRDHLMGEQAISHASLRARNHAEAALRVSEARFRAIFNEAGVGIALSDLKARMLDVNPALAAMLGYPTKEMIGRTAFDYIQSETGEGRASFSQYYNEQVRGERDQYRVARKLRHRSGRLLDTEVTISLIRDASGRPAYQLGVVEDFTERFQLLEKLRHQALHDPLTGLGNRSLVNEWLGAKVSAVSGTSVGVCLIDIHRFKMINDSLGHEVGDRLLVEVAERLSSTVGGEGRLVARMGGDEFALLLSSGPMSPLVDAELVQVAESVLQALEAPFQIAGHGLSVSARIGVLQRSLVSSKSAELLLRDADITLQLAKKSDGDKIAVYDLKRNDCEIGKFTLAATMPAALERREFYVEYQPLVGFADSKLLGVEALVRWEHPELGQLGPDEFISLAEETGLIISLGQWVLETACHQAGDWYRRFGDRAPFVSVNLAVRQAQDSAIVDTVRNSLAESGLPPRLLQLELTESAVVSRSGEPLRTLRTLADLGAWLAIDDFGTGYSNLAYLGHLPMHALKLASVFVERLVDEENSNPADLELVRSLINLGHGVKLSVTAEGVETQNQAELLRTMGCDCGQGWLFGRPGPPDAIEEMLKR